ncbi:MAG: DUF5916 domain-containing protein [Gemmatimonadota bacterium]
MSRLLLASCRTALVLTAFCSAVPRLVVAQSGEDGAVQELRTAIDGSPPPVAPASITRDALGRPTVRAIRLEEPLVLDGVLDEDVYRENQPFGGFIQVVPQAGASASERSEIWVGFDETHMYVSCRCWDAAAPSEWLANELRRDAAGLRNNENFGVMFDTYYDRRSGSMFYTNPLGGRADYQVVDEGGPNSDWNPVWDVATGRFDGGWTAEMAIPFKSLRYLSGTDRVWGIQMRRGILHKNEWIYLSPVPANLAGPQGFNRVSAAGTLVGLDLPSAGNNLEIKPYGIAGLRTDRTLTPAVSNDGTADAGLDIKYGVTANLTADLTVNTDFAQVEVDEQQVNLTRFSLFFPEKREFFLEGRGVFDFGGGGGGRMGFGPPSDAPTLFYSRRIGLDDGEVVPIRAGGRLTGKVGAFGVGAMNIQTGGVGDSGIESTNFSVLRIKRDILRRSSFGAIATNRSIALDGGGSSQTFGADAQFAFFTNLELGTYYARTETPTLTGNDESYQGRIQWNGDLYGADLSFLKVGEDFNPEIGFLRRRDFEKSAASARFSPRPRSIEAVRQLTWEAKVDYFEDGLGRMESRSQNGQFDVDFENSDRFSIQATRNYERIDQPFNVTSDLTVLPGAYAFTDYRASYNFGPHRRLSGNVSVNWGDFFDGTLTTIGVNRARVVLTDRLSLEPGVSLNLIDLPAGSSTETVSRLRADYAFTPRMFASALMQYGSGSDIFSSNLRFRWEYQPGSEVFFVWTDERDTGPGGTGLRNRALILKITRLLRY